MSEANSEISKGKRGRWAVLPTQLLHYAVALLSVALAVGTNLLFNPYLAPTLTPPFFAAVMVSAWYGGLGPGLLATALSTLAINYFLVEPLYSLDIPNLGTLARLGVFVMAAILINSLNAAQRVAQRRAEANLQALRESEARFSRLAASNIIGIIVADLNGLILEANDIFLQMVGYTQQELHAGRVHWREMTPPESLEVSERAVQELTTTGACTPFEKEYIRKDGSRVPVLHGAAMAGETTLIGFVLDLSERKRGEAERKQAEAAQQEAVRRERALYIKVQSAKEQLETVLASINDQFFVLDREWCYTYVSDRVVEVVGISRENLLGNCIWEVFPETVGTQFYAEVHRAAAEQRIVHFEYFYSPWQRWFENHIYPSATGVSILVTEITDRKRTQETLERTNKMLQTLIDVCPVAIAFFNSQGIVRLWNRAAEQIFGWSAEEAIGQFMPTVPHRPQEFLASIQTVLSGRSLDGLEARHQCKNGRMVDLEIWANLTHDAQGNPGCLGIAWDITQRKQAEAALVAQEQRYRYIFEAVSVAIWEEDFTQVKAAIDQLKVAGVRDFHQYFAEHPEFVQQAADKVRLRDVNQAALRMFGTQDKAQLLTCLRQIFVPETQEAFIGELLAIAAEEPFFAAETELRTLQGDRFHVWLTIAFPSTSESYDRVLVSLLDISERKQAELEIRKFVSLTDNSSEFIGMYDMNFVPFYVNAAGRQMVGIDDVQQYSETPVREFFFPEDQDFIVNEFFPSVLREGRAEVEIRFRHFKTGEALWMIYNVFYIRDENDRAIGLATVSRNITDRKQAEAERERLLVREQAAREQAEAANRIKDEFLAVLSHELRSPLNPILGWAKLLRTRKLDEQKTAQALETIERNANLQTQLIGDLLDVSRILQGKLNLNIAPVDLATTIAAAMETVRLAAQAKSIQIQTPLNEAIGKVSGDSGRLQQIIWNLLTNAVKFTPEGGRVEVRLERVGTHAQITVSDTGKGISPDFLPYVFDYFRQADSATTRKFGGLGLGLAIVRHLTELHGGTVRAQSLGEGQGATFIVRLPLLKQAAGLENEPSPNSSTDVLAASPLAGFSILVVDDDADTREYLSFVLEQAGATVICAASADEALQVLVQSTPDILLSDIGMPEMDGYMLMRQVRAMPCDRGRQIRAIALTAYAGEINQQQALAAGFQRHIAKPVAPETLVQEIENMVSCIYSNR